MTQICIKYSISKGLGYYENVLYWAFGGLLYSPPLCCNGLDEWGNYPT